MIYYSAQKEHGLHQWAVFLGWFWIRLSIGGYGNYPRPAGTWTIVPRIFHGDLHWLNGSVAFRRNMFLVGWRKIL